MDSEEVTRFALLRRSSKPRSPLLRLFGFVLFLSLPLVIILSFHFLPSPQPPVNEGQVVERDVKSPRRVSFVSQIRTQEERDLAGTRVPEAYRYDATVYRQQMEAASTLFLKAGSVRGLILSSFQDRPESLRRTTGLKFSNEAAEAILALEAPRWQSTVSATLQFLDSTMRNKIASDQVEEIKVSLPDRVEVTLSKDQALVASEVISAFLKPTMVLDQVATERARKEARDAVPAVWVTIEKGETILRNGDIAKGKDLEKLEAAGILSVELRWQFVAGVALLVFTLATIIGLYIFLIQRRLLSSDRRLLLLVVVIVASVLAAKLTIPGRDLVGYVFPFAAVPMLIAILVDTQIALLAAVVGAVLIGYVGGSFGGNSLEMIVAYLAAGMIGALAVRNADRLNRFFLAGGAVAVACFLVYLTFRLLTQDYVVSEILVYAFASLVHGALAAVMTVGTYTVLGNIFGIATTFHLLELAHPNQPLLRRLLTEAPGTYHHSIIVGNLAERAAEMVEGDALLVRVGSYYHDVGKINRAEFFVENQLSGENIHDHLKPQVSASIVASHVRDGLELAQKYRLPTKVQDFIVEHHGTRLVSFFYQQACRKDGPVDEQTFRYPGPLPQSKETAIVMLADSVEAAVRGMKERSPEQMDRLVDKIVAERLTEGQLDECQLTLKDLQQVRQAFKLVLRGVFHPRLEYPSLPTGVPALVTEKTDR